jgi:hypothetical protein
MSGIFLSAFIFVMLNASAGGFNINSYSDDEMKKAKEKFDSNIPKTIAYIEKECGWKAEVLSA